MNRKYETTTTSNLVKALDGTQGVFGVRQGNQNLIVCPVEESTIRALLPNVDIGAAGGNQWEITRITDSSTSVIGAIEQQLALAGQAQGASGGIGAGGGGNVGSTSYTQTQR